ncbi:hypothetical protein TNCV_900871 [Trichonephila clavipes]|nr:hypothetical protein TNCV_900871 [Trichonephila clavipes]
MGRQHVDKWCHSFQSGRPNVENRNMVGSGRPSSSTSVTPSPDLAASDYFLFLRLREHLSSRWFSSDNAEKTSIETWLNGLGPDF